LDEQEEPKQLGWQQVRASYIIRATVANAEIEFNASDIGAKMGERVDSMRIYVTTVWEGIVQQDHASVQEETDFKDAIKSSGVHAKSLSESERSYQRGETNEKEKVTRRQQVLVILTAFAVIFQTSGT
jgi:hypothetical protein